MRDEYKISHNIFTLENLFDRLAAIIFSKCNFWRLSVRIRQKLIFLRHVNRRDWAQLVQGMMGIMLSIK